MFNRKVAPPSTTEILDSAVSRVDADLAELSSQRDFSLSIFRDTANSLSSIIEDLNEKSEQLKELRSYIDKRNSAISQMVEDNTKVRDRILEILGE